MNVHFTDAGGCELFSRRLERKGRTNDQHFPGKPSIAASKLTRSATDRDRSRSARPGNSGAEVAALLHLLTAGCGPVLSSVYIATCPQLAKAAVRAADEGGF